MSSLWESLVQLVGALVNVLLSLGELLLPWAALIAWIAFWLLAVNWVRLREVLLSGGWTGLLLIGVVWVLVWGVVSPPPDGMHYLFGLTVSNFIGKTIYVTTLICIMLLCGTVQLSGMVDCCIDFSRYETAADDHDHHGHDHGHGHHGDGHHGDGHQGDHGHDHGHAVAHH